jgi:predicted Zn-dependent protease with MMP-like domain
MTAPQPEPSLGDIDALARRALAALPRRFRRELGPVVVRVEDVPDAETATAMRLRHPLGLLGLYHGVALPNKSVSEPQPHIDMIFLYRRPILAYCAATGEPVHAVVGMC